MSMTNNGREQFEQHEIATLLELRRALHREPELSWKESATAARLEEALEKLGARDIRRVAQTGVTATIPGSDRDGPAVAIRGDIDALPIHEETGLDYASIHPGVMHACGHDVHATWTVGAAMLLARRPAAGDVQVILQPAEEVGAGALAILESGALDRASMIFGGHVDRRFAVGQVVAEPGPLAASADNFEIDVLGRGSHGARPHEGADPIVCAAAIVTALQTIVSRRVPPDAPAVVSLGTIHAGTAPNVIPDRASLSGTLRATSAPVRQKLCDEVAAVARGIAAAHGVEADVRIRQGTPPIVNGEREAAWAREAAVRALGADSVVPFGLTNMGGEDFAFYMEKIPGCFMRVGAREEGGKPVAAHSPRFYAADGAIFAGAAVLAECARVAGEKLRG